MNTGPATSVVESSQEQDRGTDKIPTRKNSPALE